MISARKYLRDRRIAYDSGVRDGIHTAIWVFENAEKEAALNALRDVLKDRKAK